MAFTPDEETSDSAPVETRSPMKVLGDTLTAVPQALGSMATHIGSWPEALIENKLHGFNGNQRNTQANFDAIKKADEYDPDSPEAKLLLQTVNNVTAPIQPVFDAMGQAVTGLSGGAISPEDAQGAVGTAGALLGGPAGRAVGRGMNVISEPLASRFGTKGIARGVLQNAVGGADALPPALASMGQDGQLVPGTQQTAAARIASNPQYDPKTGRMTGVASTPAGSGLQALEEIVATKGKNAAMFGDRDQMNMNQVQDAREALMARAEIEKNAVLTAADSDTAAMQAQNKITANAVQQGRAAQQGLAQAKAQLDSINAQASKETMMFGDASDSTYAAKKSASAAVLQQTKALQQATSVANRSYKATPRAVDPAKLQDWVSVQLAPGKNQAVNASTVTTLNWLGPQFERAKNATDLAKIREEIVTKKHAIFAPGNQLTNSEAFSADTLTAAQEQIDAELSKGSGGDWKKYLDNYSTGAKKIQSFVDGQDNAYNAPRRTSVGEVGSTVAGMVPTLPHILSRGAVTANFGLGLFSKFARTRVTEQLGDWLANPDKMKADLANMAPPQRKFAQAIIRNAMITQSGMQGQQSDWTQ